MTPFEHPPINELELKTTTPYMLDTLVVLDMIKNPADLAGQRFKAMLGDNDSAELCISVFTQC